MGRNHVLIGTGPAAMAAAEAIRAADRTASITMVGSEQHGYYSRPGLAYYLANEIPESGLFPFTSEDVAALGVALVHDRAVTIDRERRRVVLASGATIPYDRLLLATGCSALPVHVAGFELDGVVKLDDLDDAKDLIARCRKAKTAVVVGGGITALELVEGLRAHKVHVHYLMRKERYWSNVLSEAESRVVERGLESRGVKIHYFSELESIEGRGGRVTAVRCLSGESIPCDLVAVAIGVVPNKALAQDAGLACERGVLVDEFLRSSDPDIYAAGDVAEVCEVSSGHRVLEVLWSSAVDKGRIAGMNMAGEPTHQYVEPAPLNVTRLAGSKITIIGTVGSGADSDIEGIARGDSEIWRELGEAATVERQLGDAHVRLELGARAIEGAVVMGDQELSFPLQELITQRVEDSDAIQRLREPHAPVAELVTAMWNDWVARHA